MRNLLLILLLFTFTRSNAQVGLGLVYASDLYQWYANPVVEGVDAKRSSGAAISSIALGPKLWMGGNSFSFSLEAQANFAPFSFDVNEYKGLGAVAFPLLGKFNFGAASGFNEDKLLGWSIGGGIQYNRTELFGLTQKFDHIERDFFPTYVGEASVNLGIAGFDFAFYLRLGFAEDMARSMNIGYSLNFNFGQMSRMGKRFKNGDDEDKTISL